MGSFLFPNDPVSKSAPPLGGSRAGSAAATLTHTARMTTAPPPAPGRSRRLRIAMHRGVDILEQPHVLRAHLDLHAAAAHVERAPVDGHIARRGDQVVRPVV